jgi:hypothetical protein
MINSSLSEFTNKAREKNRISFGDVQRLQRNILPGGIGSREEAELLIDLDRDVARADAAWSGFLIATLVDFVVWAERPTGIVDEDTARWLMALLTADSAGAVTRTARLIAREIVEEAQTFENDALALLASTLAQPKARQAERGSARASLAA